MNSDDLEKKARSFIGVCPRCGDHTFEQLRTHNHCVNCLYFETKNERDVLLEVFLAEKALSNFETNQFKQRKKNCE
jgi:ribosomal protein L37E